MRYGISAAALIVQDQRVLLVNHRLAGQFDFWLPPGGRLEGQESIFAPHELIDLDVRPAILKGPFWIDVDMEHPPSRYLGLVSIRD